MADAQIFLLQNTLTINTNVTAVISIDFFFVIVMFGSLVQFYFFFKNFTAPSFDDKILEVVAVFGSMQMAVSRVIDLHHHRICQVEMMAQKYTPFSK